MAMSKASASVQREPLVSLRVLTEFDESYGVFVSRCLETGHVVTADTGAGANAMMDELLHDEISYAVEHQNLPNLFSSPASFDVLARWMEQSRKKPPVVTQQNIEARALRLDDEREVQAEIKTANT